MNIVLMGYHGCGKTLAGKKLASRLWKQFVEVKGSADGTAGGAEKQAAAVRQALGEADRVVVLGADVLLNDACAQSVKAATNARRIYLRCTAEVLSERLRQANRPRADLEAVRRELAVCVPGYEAAADRVVDVTHLDVEGTVREVIRRCL